MADATRSQRQKSLKEDVKHLLEELWEAEKEDALYKIFTKESKRGMQKFLRYSREDLKDLSYVEEDGTELKLKKHEIGEFRMQVQIACPI